MQKLYIQPIEGNKFACTAMYCTTAPADASFIEATQETLDGLTNHTLCWQDGKIVSYTKTAEEIAKEEVEKKLLETQGKIFALKAKLRDTDYKAIKFAEGEMTAEEFEPVKAERRAWRAEINELELLLNE